MNNIFLLLSIIILIFTVIKAKKNINDTKRWIPISILGMTVSLAILIFPLSTQTDFMGKLVNSILYSAQTIILNENLGILDNLHIINIFDTIYIGIIYLLTLLMPLLTVSFLLTLIGDFTTKFQLYFTRKKDILIFSELNEKSVTIAKHLYNKDKTIIFANCDKDDAKNYDLKGLNITKFYSIIENINLKRIKSNTITIYLVNEIENENLTLTLRLIEKNKSLNKKIKIYTILNDEVSRIILDSTDKGNIQLEIVNEVERTIIQLLQDKPIYLNAINHEISVLIVGCGKVGREFLKIITWCGQIIGYKLKINIIDIRANHIKEVLSKECPELIANYDYNFIEADINSQKALDELKKLKNINYVVVTLQDDEINIKEAIYLRKYFLLQDKENYNNKPIINIWIKDEEKSMQINYLRADEKTQYNLNAFGSINDIYYKYPIIDSKIEHMSQRVHLIYNADDVNLKKYYETEYNVKSSRATATHIKYKIYSVLKDEYTGDIGTDLSNFEKKLQDDKIFNELVKNEHNRWIAYMRSDGYQSASIADVEKYREKINDAKHILAKLHPAIAEFEKLDEIEHKLNKNYKDSDIKIIKNIPYIYKEDTNV